MSHLESHELEKPLQKVLEHVGSVISDMWIVVDRWATGVQLYFPLRYGFERLDLSAESVKKSYHSPIMKILPQRVNKYPELFIKNVDTYYN
jgi:hypothetical protein